MEHSIDELITKIEELDSKSSQTLISEVESLLRGINNKQAIPEHLTGKVYYTNRPDDYEIQEGSSSSFDDWYKEYQIIEEQETEDGKKEFKDVVEYHFSILFYRNTL